MSPTCVWCLYPLQYPAAWRNLASITWVEECYNPFAFWFSYAYVTVGVIVTGSTQSFSRRGTKTRRLRQKEDSLRRRSVHVVIQKVKWKDKLTLTVRQMTVLSFKILPNAFMSSELWSRTITVTKSLFQARSTRLTALPPRRPTSPAPINYRS